VGPDNKAPGLLEMQGLLDVAQMEAQQPSVDELLQQGVDANEYNQFLDYQRNKYNEPLGAAALGVVRGATLGLSDVAASVAESFGASGAREYIANVKEYNPVASTIGEVGGLILGTPGAGALKAVGGAARAISAPLRAADKIGRAVEYATINAARKAGPNALAKILGSGANQAAQGALFGAGQVVSDAALADDYEFNAEKIAATVGLSAILSGTVGASLSTLSRGLDKGIKLAKPYTEAAKKSLTGLGKDTRDFIKKYPDKISKIVGASDDPAEAINGYVQALATRVTSAGDDFVKGTMETQRRMIQELPASAQLKSPTAGRYIDFLEKEIEKISGGDDVLGGALTSTPSAGKIAKIRQLQQEIAGVAAQNVPEGGAVSARAVQLTPKQVWALRTRFYNDSKFRTDIGGPVELADVYNKLYLLSNGYIGALAPALKASNKKLSQVIQAKKALSRRGFADKFEVNPEKLRTLVGANDDQWFFAKQQLEKLDNVYSTDFANEIQALRAVKEVYPKDIFSRAQTGRSMLAPAVAGAVGSLIGGPAGAAAGVIAGAAMNTAPAQMSIYRAGSRVADMGKKALNDIAKAGGNVNAYIPVQAMPWAVAKAVSVNTLSDYAKQVDSKLNRSAAYIFNEDELTDVDPNPLDKTNFGGGRVRKTGDQETAFANRYEEIENLALNPETLSRLIEMNLAEIAETSPELAQIMGRNTVNTIQNVYRRLPKAVTNDPLEPVRPVVPDSQRAAFARYVKAVDDPMSILKEARAGRVTKDEVDALKENYPIIYNQLVYQLVERAKTKSVSYKDKLKIRALIGDNALVRQNTARLQSNFASQNQDLKQSATPKAYAQNRLTEVQRMEYEQ
jgi:hypothetical protein